MAPPSGSAVQAQGTAARGPLGRSSALFGELLHVMPARYTEATSYTSLQVVAAGWAPYRVCVWEDQAAAKVLQSRSLVGHRSAPNPAATSMLRIWDIATSLHSCAPLRRGADL